MAQVQQAIEAAQKAAANLAAAVSALPAAAADKLPSDVAEMSNTAQDHANAAITLAADQLKGGAASLSAAAKAAADKAAAAIPKS